MDPYLYEAAMVSNIEVLKQQKDQLGVQLTANKSTVLHVAAQFHDNIECVKVILNLQPSLLCRVNSNLETALHIAARNGHSNTVRLLVQHAQSLQGLKSLRTCARLSLFSPVWKSVYPYFSITTRPGVQIIKEMMISMTSEHKDTALHKAVRNKHLDVVEILVGEGAVFPHVVNNFEETPLYIAAKKDTHSHDIVSTILDVCISPAHSGPNGRTALHAAVIAGCSDCTNKILEKKPNLVKKADLDGWTPLHHAAYLNIVPCARQLLYADKSIVYNKDHDRQTAFHIAASQGHIDIMKELLSHSPDCWEMVNGKGRNILHIAVEHEKMEMIDFIRSRDVKGNLESQMDNKGNTPFNLAAVSNKGSTSIIEGNRPKEDEIKDDPKAENAEMGEEDYNKIRDTQLVVATLIATVTFAAGLTLPGGFHSNEGPDQGRALLVKNCAFQLFVILNAGAMAFSSSAILLHLVSSLTKLPMEPQKQFVWGHSLIKYAMFGMILAFMCGSYAVLANSSVLAVAMLVAVNSLFLVNLVISTGCSLDAIEIWLRWYCGIFLEKRNWPTFLRHSIRKVV